MKINVLIAALSAGLVFTLGYNAVCGAVTYSDNVQRQIADEVIRFHILANSNSDDDQRLKADVKDAFLKEYGWLLSDSDSITETRDALTKNMDDISTFVNAYIKDAGYDYTANCYMSRDYFPTRLYGDVAFPPGEYETLKIVIENGDGNNWWCILFPPLCYVDVAKKEIPDEQKKELKTLLTDDGYKLVTSAGSDAQIPVKVKFKIVELLKSRERTAYAAK